MATRRQGKPYIWVTWLAKLLGGNECVYSAWFKAHFKYQRFEEQAADLVKWNRDHNALMAKRRRELERDGWIVTVEDQNAFKLEGESAVVAGKMDLVAVKGDDVLVIDGKTGRQRESDIWQVLLYLFALPKCRPDLPKNLEGQVHYKDDDISVTPDDLDAERLDRVVSLIKAVAADEPPAKRPSRAECKRCNIGRGDCPDRVMDEKAVACAEF